jgi:hypothetical protein
VNEPKYAPRQRPSIRFLALRPVTYTEIRNFPDATGTLLTYEPRIRSIDVELNDVPDPELNVSYVMSCHLKKAGLVRFGTYFDPPGRMRVQRVERER